MRRAVIAVCLSALLPACGPPPQPVAPKAAYDVAAAVRRLALPPDEHTPAALEELRTEAKGGDVRARLARTFYLLDLFDHARFAAAPKSRKLLFEELGGSSAAPGGEVATEWVAEHLDNQLRHVPDAGPEVAAARALLAVELADAHADRARLFARVKRIARDPGNPLRANAILRLYGYCARALRDARSAPRPDRARVANHCLYVLYDSDPAAYFGDDPELRPPDPPWTAYRAGLVPLLDELARTPSRLAPVAERLSAADRRFFAELAPGALPMPLDVADAGLPRAPGAALWEHTPVARLVREGVSLGGTPIADDVRLRTELAALVKEDPRRTLTVVAATNEPTQRVLRLAEAARAAGVRVLALGVALPVTLKAPPGDYWAGRKVARLGVLPVSLAAISALGGAPGGAATRDDRRAAGWDPARDELGLTLTVDDAFVLAAHEGLVARMPADLAALRSALQRVRSAFPDQSALALALGERPTYGDLVAVVWSAVRDSRGVPLFPALGLLSAPPRVTGSIETRVARRAAVEVAVAVEPAPSGRHAPAALGALTAQVRRCYLAAADRKGVVLGHLVFRIDARGVTAATARRADGPAARDRALQACVRDRLEQTRREPGSPLGPGVAVRITPRPAR